MKWWWWQLKCMQWSMVEWWVLEVINELECTVISRQIVANCKWKVERK